MGARQLHPPAQCASDRDLGGDAGDDPAALSGLTISAAGYLLNVAYFAALFAFSAIVAFIADVLLVPALMVLMTRWEQRRAAA